MTQFWDDWGDVPDGDYSSVQPPFRDWEMYTAANYLTRRIESAEYGSPPQPTGKTLRYIGSASRRLRYTALGTELADVSLAGLFNAEPRHPTASVGLHVRMGVSGQGYALRYVETNGGELRLLLNDAVVLSAVPGLREVCPRSAWHWLSLTAVGSTITGRLLSLDLAAVAEVQANDASVAAGAAGISVNGNASGYINGFGAGVAGDAAPFGPIIASRRTRLIMTPW